MEFSRDLYPQVSIHGSDVIDGAIILTESLADTGEQGPNVFIAHNRRDMEIAARIAEALEYEDLRPKIAAWEVTPGDSFVEWMEKRLRESNFLILVWSKNAAESDWVRREWAFFLPRFVTDPSIKIIPIRLDEEPLPALLSDLVCIEFSSNMKDLMNEILVAVYGRGARKSHREKLAEAQNDVLNTDDPLPIVACAACGGLELEGTMHGDDYGNYEIIVITCKECGWSIDKDVTRKSHSRSAEDPF